MSRSITPSYAELAHLHDYNRSPIPFRGPSPGGHASWAPIPSRQPRIQSQQGSPRWSGPPEAFSSISSASASTSAPAATSNLSFQSMHNSDQAQFFSSSVTLGGSRTFEQAQVEPQQFQHQFSQSESYDYDNFDLQPCFDAEFVYPEELEQEPKRFELSQTSQQKKKQSFTTNSVTSKPIPIAPPVKQQPPQLQNIQQSWHIQEQYQSFQSQGQIVEDEGRLAEFQTSIVDLQDERERMQVKTFTKWINSYLSKHSPNLQINNLLEDLKDGVKLITLLKIISGERLPIEKGRRRHHFLCNYNTVLQFLEQKQIKLVNINTCDLVDGRPPVLLGLLWTIILHFQIEEHASSLTPPSTPPEKAPPKDNAKHALLQWVQGIFAQNRVPLQINNFGGNWKDGLAFSYLVHCMKAGLVDLDGLQNAPNQARLSSSFKVAESRLGIPAILDPSDVDVSSPDEKSVMMYVAQFLHWYNQPPPEEPEAEPEPELSLFVATPEPELSPFLSPEPEVYESQPEEFLTPPEQEVPPPPPQPQPEPEPAPPQESKEESVYQSDLDDVEKWFLQTSVELMQANSVCPQSLSQAEEQLKKDDCLLKKIHDYSHILENLAERGFELIGLQPSLNELITKQLKSIKDRYDSLLQTANEISQRHSDFYEKFLEYANVLQSVCDELTQIDGDIQTVPEGTEVELAIGHLEGLRDALQGEKIRLDLASQVCQAATASLSRERSSAPLISEKEMQTRAWMNELMEKLQDKMKLLHSTQAELDAAKHEKDGIMDWLKQAGLALERINSQPIPLSPEKAGMEKAQLESLLNDIRQTKQACVDKPELIGPLDKLEGDTDSVLKNRQHLHNDILGLLALLKNADGWLGGMESNGVELLKSGSAGFEKLQQILTELEQVGPPKLAEIDEKWKGTISLLNNQDKTLVEGQVDGLGKRLAELKRKLVAEQNILETSQKGLQDLLRELNEFNCESENIKMALGKSKPGYLVATAEPVLFAVQDSLKEFEGRKIKVMQMQEKLNSLQNQVEPNEMGKALQMLESSRKKQEDLQEKLNHYLTYLRDGIGLRKKFEDEVNFIRYFINRVVGDINLRHFPLQSIHLKPLIEGLGKLENELLETRKTVGEEIKSEAGMLLNDCDEIQGMELNKLISELDLDGILGQFKNYKEFLGSCLGERKWFEDEYGQVWNKIQEVQKFIQASNQNGKAAEEKAHWEDELAGCMKHLAECEGLNGKVQMITEKGTALFPSLIEKDHPVLQAKLKELTQQLSNAGDQLKQKMGLSREGLKNAEMVGAIVDETRHFLDSLKDKLDALKSPIGFGIEDSEGRLSEYEAVLECLKAYRKKLDDQAVQELQSPDLQKLMAEQDSIAAEVEAEIAKLKRLLHLQQQFLALVMELTNFIVKFGDIPKEIEKAGVVIDEKIKRYTDAVGAIKGCEGLLSKVDEQAGLIVKEEIIKEDERKAIVEQVGSLKSQLGGLKKTVEDKRAEHLKTAELYRKYLAELEGLLKWLGENEKGIESKPILERPANYVEAELTKHEKLTKEFEQRLGQVERICKELKHEDCLPQDLGDKLRLGQTMLERMPGKIKDRKDYLMLMISLRNNLGSDMEGIWGWVKEYKTKLAGREGGIDFDSIEAVAELHSQDFGQQPKKFIQDGIIGVGELVRKVIPSLNDVDQDNLRKEQQCLCEAVQNIFNTAQTIQAKLEQARSIYKTFHDLANMVEGSLRQAQVQEEPTTNLLSLGRNLAAIQNAFENLQKEQPQLDSLKEWACSAENLANPESKTKLQSQIKLVDSKWAESLKGLESRKENLNKLGMDWEKFNELCGKFEADLALIEQRFSQVNPFNRNMEELQQTQVALNKILSDGKALEGPRNELVQSFQKLEKFKDIQVGALKPRMDQLSSQYSNVLSLLENKLELIVNQGKYLDWIEKEAEKVRNVLANLEGDIQSVDPFQKEYSNLDSSISNFEKKLKDVGKEITNLNSQIKDKFTSWKQIMPSSISLTCGNLELRHDEVKLHLDDGKKNIKQARTLIAEFERDVQTLKSWTFSAETQLEQTLLDEPTQQKKVIQNLLSEYPGALYQMERAAKAGTTIAAKIQNPKESQITKAVVEETEEHILKLKGSLEEHKMKVNECLEFWQRFMELYAQVMEWVSEQNGLLKEPVKLTCLEETHLKLDNYLSAVQGMKGVTKRLSQMSKEAASVGELPCVSILYKKLDEAEQAKTDVGGQLLENSSLLQEAVEEWEQFEKKLKDAQSWLKKSRQTLEQSAAAGSTKIRPTREKLLAGVGVQRIKIGMALEKLQVHFRAGLGGNTNVEAEQKQIDRELESFGNEVKALELSLSSKEP